MQLIEVPPTKNPTICHLFGMFSGIVHYARHELGQFEIWILNEKEDCTKNWSLKHKVGIEITSEKYPELCQNPNRTSLVKFEAFHLMNPRFIFLSIYNNKRVLYDVYSSTLELVCDHGDEPFNYIIVPYTYDLIGHHIFHD
ncbi:hypothetical protein AQUCO_00900053v1 [Aquilegia coerulea]|uniref:Uncharacterized protein n=1 Tax=Aquilegia coerulea TaxID=218851 RepID=A0A2G5ECA8_AQUCA|nr:hypothetical protein AQUCO_00900053v1 [Aquilegia coerulea]